MDAGCIYLGLSSIFFESLYVLILVDKSTSRTLIPNTFAVRAPKSLTAQAGTSTL